MDFFSGSEKPPIWNLVIVIGTREAVATESLFTVTRRAGEARRDFAKMIQIRPMNVSAALPIAR